MFILLMMGEEEITDHGPFQFSKIVNENLLKIMSWGKETFPYPLKDVIVIHQSEITSHF